VDLLVDLDAPCGPEELFDHIDDLGTYPTWLEIVERAEAVVTQPADDGDAAWLVDLRARLGPLARSKRLRMVRTVSDRPHSARFERREQDGRDHSPWVLEASVEATATGSRLVMSLHYGGGFGDSVLEHLLGQAVERSKPALLAQVS
jgi:hypothetical protein